MAKQPRIIVGTLVSPIEGLKLSNFNAQHQFIGQVGTLVSPIEGLKQQTYSERDRRDTESERL